MCITEISICVEQAVLDQGVFLSVLQQGAAYGELLF